MTTFVTLASPTVADIPSRLAIFLAANVVLSQVGAACLDDTRGALVRQVEPAVAPPWPRSKGPA